MRSRDRNVEPECIDAPGKVGLDNKHELNWTERGGSKSTALLTALNWTERGGFKGGGFKGGCYGWTERGGSKSAALLTALNWTERSGSKGGC